MGSGAEADGHFLDDASHDEGEHDEWEKESNAVVRAGGGIGEHAGAVIFSEHDEDAGADQQPEQAGARPGAMLGTGFGDAVAVMGAIDIFVGDDDGGGVEVGVRRQFPRRLRGFGGLVHAEEAAELRAWPTY